MTLAQGFARGSGQPTGYRYNTGVVTTSNLPTTAALPVAGQNVYRSAATPNNYYAQVQSSGIPRSALVPNGANVNTDLYRSMNVPQQYYKPPVDQGAMLDLSNLGRTTLPSSYHHPPAQLHYNSHHQHQGVDSRKNHRSSSKTKKHNYHYRSSTPNKSLVSEATASRHTTRKSGKKRIWDKVLCMNKGSSKVHQSTNRFKGFDQLHLDDDALNSPLDILNSAAPRGAFRRGPQRRNSADLNITVRDLFPCIGDVLDTCGLGKGKRTRMLNQPIIGNRGLNRNVPQLETVCLDCGHVLDKQHLDKSVLRDAIGLHATGPPFQPETVGGTSTAHKHHHHHMNNLARRHKLESAQPKIASQFAYGYGDTPREWDRKSTYSGYEGWEITSPLHDKYTGPDTVGSTAAHKRVGTGHGGDFEEKVILPNFMKDDPRKFKSRPGSARPGASRWIDSDYFEVDDTGRVALPQFVEKP
eukprot:Lankesteria_metandrocarpae@DN3141_c0_g1_i1.p1